jgi:hypothetical protein
MILKRINKHPLVLIGLLLTVIILITFLFRKQILNDNNFKTLQYDTAVSDFMKTDTSENNYLYSNLIKLVDNQVQYAGVTFAYENDGDTVLITTDRNIDTSFGFSTFLNFNETKRNLSKWSLVIPNIDEPIEVEVSDVNIFLGNNYLFALKANIKKIPHLKVFRHSIKGDVRNTGCYVMAFPFFNLRYKDGGNVPYVNTTKIKLYELQLYKNDNNNNVFFHCPKDYVDKFISGQPIVDRRGRVFAVLVGVIVNDPSGKKIIQATRL